MRNAKSGSSMSRGGASGLDRWLLKSSLGIQLSLNGMCSNMHIIDTSEGGCVRDLARSQALLRTLSTAHATHLVEALPQTPQ